MAGITTLAAGDNEQNLLFVAVPESEVRLARWASTLKSDPEIQSRLCLEGFAEVQFIVRDQESNQKLVDKFQTSPGRAFLYLNQRYGAKPME